MRDLIEFLLSKQRNPHSDTPVSSLETFLAFHLEFSSRWVFPFDQCVIGGFLADRLGFAFVGGYQAALRQLVPDLPASRRYCLCVTERMGGHPRTIESTLSQQPEGWVLSGAKQWSTMAGSADEMLVAASTGWEDEKNLIRIVRVDATDPGVSLKRMPTTPFAPEIPHYEVEFDQVSIVADKFLPGDAYEAYIKPFRTVEDIHVCGATIGYLFGLASKHLADHDTAAQLAHLLVSLRSLAEREPNNPASHVVLHGTMLTARRFFETMPWPELPDDVSERWRRDCPILEVGSSARARRFEVAWNRLFESGLDT